MNERIKLSKEKKNKVKQLIQQLHEEKNVEEVRIKFKKLLASMSPPEITRVEEELIEEGMDPKEIYSMCDIHMEVFQEALESDEDLAPQGHPINILMGEHTQLIGFAKELFQTVQELKKVKGFPYAANILGKIQDIVHHFKEAEKHYLREENVLFPYLEKHGVTQPPKIMWMDHDKIRDLEKRLYKLIDERKISDYDKFVSELEKVVVALAEMQNNHFNKENKILFPTGLSVIEEEEWQQIRTEFDDIGYCCFTPDIPEKEGEPKKEKANIKGDNLIKFTTGELSIDALEKLLNTLPIDITFVDKDDKVAYFNDPEDRFFVRTPAVLGRSVQNCHPQKSIHIVNKIMNAFKEGTKDKAEFWIQLGDDFLHIRYFPVRDKEGNYLGTLEVTQEIGKIKELKGEQRLLDWE